jgi:anti-sigma B factor antagonist
MRRAAKTRDDGAMTSDAQFEVMASDQPGVAVLAARGEIDVASAPEFQASLSDLIEEGPNILIVDTSDVSFIDSTGLGVLIGAEKQLRSDGRRLHLVVTQPQITRLLALTGLNEVFTVMSNTNDASNP